MIVNKHTRIPQLRLDDDSSYRNGGGEWVSYPIYPAPIEQCRQEVWGRGTGDGGRGRGTGVGVRVNDSAREQLEVCC